MSGYVHASHTTRELKESINQQIASLRRLQAAVQAEELAKEQQLAALYRDRRRLERLRNRSGSYTPSAEALAYRDKYADVIAAQPAPVHGGPLGLRRAADEMEEHEARKRQEAAA